MGKNSQDNNAGLTPREVEFYEILESLNPSKSLQRDIETTKDELRRDSQTKLHKGISRVTGFTRNENN